MKRRTLFGTLLAGMTAPALLSNEIKTNPPFQNIPFIPIWVMDQTTYMWLIRRNAITYLQSGRLFTPYYDGTEVIVDDNAKGAFLHNKLEPLPWSGRIETLTLVDNGVTRKIIVYK